MPSRALPWKIAVVGAGPAGLALALQAARKLPRAEVTVFDARPLDRDICGDPRTLALAQGSVQTLRLLQAWPAEAAQPIERVHVSQMPPTLAPAGRPAQVRLQADEEGVPMLGAVLSYGALVDRLQRTWLAREASEGGRLRTRFGRAVDEMRNLARPEPGAAVEVDAGIAETFDLAVVAEGGVFAQQARKAIAHDYRQRAWVGTVTLAGAQPGLAVERFTRHGPVALLPLPAGPQAEALIPGQRAGTRRAALVWCVPSDDDPVQDLDDRQRATVLATLLPPEAGQVVQVGPLKAFPLGLNAERTLVDGALVRIGNAAQTLHPVAGQGLNLGLRDAMVLVQALADAGGREPAAVRAALRRVEWQRAPDRWATIATTDFLARSFTWQWPGIGAARGLGLALLDKLGPAKSMLARQMMFGRR